MKKIIFVYNADSGLLNLLKDGLQKTFTPDQYQCALCSITYGLISMKKKWKDFLKTLPYEQEFLHKDEFEKKYKKANISYPTILLKENDSLTPIVTSKQLEEMNGLNNLIKTVQQELL